MHRIRMSSPLVLYDLRSEIPLDRFISPWTLKTRMVLNYKGIPSTTVWEIHASIEAAAKSIGAAATGKKPNGDPFYTAPILQNPNTGSVVSDSTVINEYLDQAFPETPKVNPAEHEALQKTFRETYRPKIRNLILEALPETFKAVPARDQEYLTVRWKDFLKEKLPDGRTRDEGWKDLKKSLDELDSWLKKGGEVFVTGDQPIELDFEIAATLLFSRSNLGEDSQEWKEVASWNNGRWSAIVAKLENATVIGVRTFLYQENQWQKENLIPNVLPSLLKSGLIKPSRVRLIDQGSFKDHVAAGLDLFRNNKVSGETEVVVKVAA